MNTSLTRKDINDPKEDPRFMLSAFPAFDRLWTKRQFLEARLIERRAVRIVPGAIERIKSVGSLFGEPALGYRSCPISAQ